MSRPEGAPAYRQRTTRTSREAPTLGAARQRARGGCVGEQASEHACMGCVRVCGRVGTRDGG